jgi:hypothetical protein
MADPVTINCSGSCAVTLEHTFNVPPFNLTEEQGALIAAAILAIWAIGWCFRALVRTVRETDGKTSNDTED